MIEEATRDDRCATAELNKKIDAQLVMRGLSARDLELLEPELAQ